MLTKGPILREFEEAAAAHLRVKHAIGVSSCTTGLMLTYQGLGLTGEVVVPSFTFMATISALVWNGLTPRYADVHASTTNLDPIAAARAITPRTSAIVAVHNFGNPAEIEPLTDLARRQGLKLVFDAAHGFGATYRGMPVGGQGDAHVFSMSPTKLLVAGEGGVVATNDDELAAHIRLGREYGNDGNYDSVFAGMNARMPEINALLALYGLEMLEDTATFRNQLAEEYRKELGALPGLEFQAIHPKDRSSYKDLSIVVHPREFGMDRDQLATALLAEGIDTRKYYDPPAHRQAAYTRFWRPEDALEHTEVLARQSLSLPIGAQVDHLVIASIARAMSRLHERREDVRAHFRSFDKQPAEATAG
jgi:dTDP-4-amino-4,6-dideoxygalactose transaminase